MIKMKNFLTLFFLIIIILITPNYAAADTVNMINGSVLKGKIVRITSDIVNIKTKEGFRKFNRVQILNNRDFIETGYSKNTQIIAGKVFFATKFIVELHTPEGILKLPRYRVRNIVLGHVHIPDEELQIQLPEQVEKEQKDLQ